MILLALTIWATWKKQAPIWKVSLLAFIFNGPGNVVRRVKSDSDSTPHALAEKDGVDTLKDMKKWAKTITIKLDSESSDMRLVQVKT
jgi:hypothetical protein